MDQHARLDGRVRGPAPELEEARCQKIFKERVPGTADRRLQLDAALDFIREGGELMLMITRLDCFARLAANLLRIVERVRSRVM